MLFLIRIKQHEAVFLFERKCYATLAALCLKVYSKALTRQEILLNLCEIKVGGGYG
jgi:hypothetical protein